MKSYTTLRNLAGTLSNNASSTNLTLMDQLINDATRRICNARQWPFLETSLNISTVASQQFYNLPSDYERLINVYITIGNQQYQPQLAPSRNFWDMLNSSTNITSDIPEWFYIFNGQVGFYPIPDTATTLAYDAQTGNFTTGLFLTGGTSGARAVILTDTDSGTTGTLTLRMVSGTFADNETITDTSTGSATVNGTASPYITIAYKRRVVDLSIADYSTGTIAAVTNGSATVTGTGTSWTTPMAGRWLKITPTSVAATSGDGVWYQISSVASSTSIILTRPYQGITLPATAGAAYIIGEMSLLPEPYQDLPILDALEVYFTSVQPEPAKAQLYKMRMMALLKQMEMDIVFKTADVAIMDGDHRMKNANLYLTYSP